MPRTARIGSEGPPLRGCGLPLTVEPVDLRAAGREEALLDAGRADDERPREAVDFDAV
ncbi:hypothetical protein GCM10027599_17550 [Yimella radicis]